jgi:hypothetical protein
MQRVSLLFDVTTNPLDLATASAHSGGWSESHWSGVDITPSQNFIPNLATARAQLLPNEASVVGFRIENFTIAGNKLIPGGTAGGRLLLPGVNANDLNLPQDALACSAGAIASPNTTRFNLRALPDSQLSRGEYQPTLAFKIALAAFLEILRTQSWGFVGRVKSNVSARVQAIAGGIVTLSANVGAVANQSYIRLNRVYDNAGNPVTGTYLVTLINGLNYTLAGLPAVTLSRPSGTARVDELQYFSYGTLAPQRAVSRKIGRPFEQYRGRASKSRA